MLVADTALARIQQFSIDYDQHEELRFVPFVTRLERAFDLSYFSKSIGDRGLMWTIEPTAIERDSNGNLWIADARNGMVHVFDADMKHLRSIGEGSADGGLRQPNDLAFSRDGATVYIVDRAARQVKMYTNAGIYQRAIVVPAEAGVSFSEPFGIAAGVDGFVYVTDAGAHRVVKFDESGKYITHFGNKGVDDGQFWKPGAIEQAADGRLFIADYGNHRAQIFSPHGEWLVSFGLGRAMTRELKANQKPVEAGAAE